MRTSSGAGAGHRRLQREDLAALVGGGDVRTHALHDRPGPLDQLRVGRLHALAQVEVVLEADPDVAAEQHRLRHPRHLHRAQGERRPHRALRQLVDHRGQRQRVGRRAVRDAHAELVHRRGVDQPLLDEGLGEPQVAGVEDLHLAADAELLDLLGALAQHVRRADVDQAALAEVEAAAVEGADVGEQLLDVGEPVDAAHQVGALDERRGVVRVEHQVAAHAGGGVDDDVDVGGPDPLDDLAVERDVPRALRRSRGRGRGCGRSWRPRAPRRCRTRRSARGSPARARSGRRCRRRRSGRR